MIADRKLGEQDRIDDGNMLRGTLIKSEIEAVGILNYACCRVDTHVNLEGSSRRIRLLTGDEKCRTDQRDREDVRSAHDVISRAAQRPALELRARTPRVHRMPARSRQLSWRTMEVYPTRRRPPASSAC